ncbi:MAG: DHH family phosphoesterase [Aigarchaeota archaeon]|nr:DHH family phosphoesterase [Aigarchaeota archaeon]
MLQPLIDLLKSLRDEKVSLVTHAGGDPDSVGASVALKSLIHHLSPRAAVDIVIPEAPTARSRRMLNYLGSQAKTKIDKDASTIILVDIGSVMKLRQVAAEIAQGNRMVVVLDHHVPVERYPANARNFVDEEKSSTCEIVYDLCQLASYPISKKDAEAIFGGMYFDSARLALASTETLRKMADLAALGVNPAKVIENLQVPMDRSEKIARLKAAQRARILDLNGKIAAVSYVGSFQSSAARALLSLGADISIVGGESKGAVAVALRSTPSFHRDTKVNLARDIAAVLGERFSGAGGGHVSAAGVVCRGQLEDVLQDAVQIATESVDRSKAHPS